MDGGSDARRITIHTLADFAGMRAAGQLAAETLDYLTPYVRVGVTTGHLDQLCHEYIVAHGATARAAQLPRLSEGICTSINHVVCHGIPGDRRLVDGDGSTSTSPSSWTDIRRYCRMFVAGAPSTRASRLMDVTYEALMRGVRAVRPGATLGDIGHAIQSHVEASRFSVVRDFCGHGIGRRFHEAPNVLHFGRPGAGRRCGRACSSPSSRW